MMRSAFLKYNFQVRIGHMDGILVAYHNTRKIFGFQYISREEMDLRLFGSSRIGHQVFKNALVMFEAVLNEATQKYPRQTLRLSFDTILKSDGDAFTNIFVEAVPSGEENSVKITKTRKELESASKQELSTLIEDPYEPVTLYRLETKSLVDGKLSSGPLEIKDKSDWVLYYQMKEDSLPSNEIKRKFRDIRKKQLAITIPSGSTNPVMQKFKRMSEDTLREEASETQNIK